LYDRLQHQTTRFVAEHRAVTSLFVQFDGIDLNAANAGEQLQAYYEWARQVVARFAPRNGRVNRLLTGDKGSQLHILFGAPVAPDAPEQAMRCALALQREKPAFITGQRIGLAAGPVFATAVGSQNRREYTAIGRVVNLSAHLAVRCPNGGLLVDEATARRVWTQFQFESLPPTTLKGHTDPVAIYRAVGEQLPPTQFAARFARWRQPAPGREAERAQLRQRLDAALRGQGGLVALSGHFGGGIRPLLAEAARLWLEAGGRGLSGVCQPHLADAPFTPWQAIWRDLFRLSPEMPLDEQSRTVAREIRTLLPTWADEIPLWLAAMGLPVPEQRTAETEIASGVRQLWLFTLVQRCLAQAARSQPLLILLEDVQWADEASLKLVAELAVANPKRLRAASEIPLLLLVTFRPGTAFHFLPLDAPATTHIILADWSAAQAQAVARRKLGTGELPPLLSQRLGLQDVDGREATQVNPLFLEESLKLILSSDVLHFDSSGRLRVDETRLAALPIPDTIATLLQTRLDALSAGTAALLQVAAVIGREFELEALVEIAPGLNKTAALALLHELVEAELVQTVAGGPEPVFIFQDSLLQEVVYRSLPYARRQSLHLAMAEWAARQPQYQNAFALLAHHYGQAEEHKAGLYYALAAADDAATLFAHRTAVTLYQQALAHLQASGVDGQADTAVNLLLAQGQSHFLLGELEAAARAVAQALEFCPAAADETLWCTAVNLLAEIGLAQARFPEAATLVGQVIEYQETIPAAILARAGYLAGLAAAGQFQWPLAEAHLEQARALLKEHRLVRPLPELLVALAMLRSKQAVELCQQAVDIAQQHELTIPAVQAMLLLAKTRLTQGRAQDAVQMATEAVELARAATPRLLAHLLVLRAEGWVYDGRFPEALADLKQAQGLFAAMDDGLGQLRLYLAWSDYCTGQGDWAGALPWLDKGREQLAALQKTGGTARSGFGLAVSEAVQLRLGLAKVALHTRQWPQAASLLAVAQADVAAHQLLWWRPALFYTQGQVQEAVGNPVVAEKAYQAALTAVNQGGNPDERPLIFLQLAQLTPAEDVRHWEYLEGCVTAVYDRARHTDKITCLQTAGTLLLQAPDLRLRRIGAGCLAAVPK
jgi:class 3 adenylate cyclase